MPFHPSWGDIALRLFFTLIAGAIIGADRGVRGHAAGLRTTILVGPAASVAMIQANLLLPTYGKAPTLFPTMDVMRLPLGILTGVGFIGGGTILHRGDLVTGITTAATLWVITVIGLCFGGDQIGIGIAATVLNLLTLAALRRIDRLLPRKQRAILVIDSAPGIATAQSLGELIAPLGYVARFYRQQRMNDSQRVELFFEITWKQPESGGPPLDLIDRLGRNYAVVSFELAAELPR